MVKNNLEGQIFNGITFIKPEGRSPKGRRKWRVKCHCGVEFQADAYSVKSGNTKSCGCSRITHGASNTRLYSIWRGMRDRCQNPNRPRYEDYGGKGIKVCEDWDNSFLSFQKWALENGYSEELTIDRIKNDGDYEPSNCRWADKLVQAQNRGTQKNNTSGRKGISKVGKKWCATIWYENKKKHLGYFHSLEEAIEAREKAEQKYWKI